MEQLHFMGNCPGVISVMLSPRPGCEWLLMDSSFISQRHVPF